VADFDFTKTHNPHTYVRLPADVKSELSKIAKDNKTTISEVIRKLAMAGLEQYREAQLQQPKQKGVE
jgi:metal-responsive CopG/Arc/MetJ family transcriptional regulator